MSDSVARINLAVDEFLEICTGHKWPGLDLRVYLLEAERQGKLTPEEIQIVEATVKRLMFERGRQSEPGNG